LAKKNLLSQELKKILLATDNEGTMVFPMAANLNEIEVFQ
jgi:hypothetical protein